MPAAISATPRGRVGVFTTILSVLLAGLAAGALWCLLALGIDWASFALIVPLALAIGVYFRWLGLRGVRGGACAVVSILLAFVYAQYLFAAVRIAQTLGFPLRSTLFKMDFGLAWQVSRASLGMRDYACLLLACAAAAFIAGRRGE